LKKFGVGEKTPEYDRSDVNGRQNSNRLAWRLDEFSLKYISFFQFSTVKKGAVLHMATFIYEAFDSLIKRQQIQKTHTQEMHR